FSSMMRLILLTAFLALATAKEIIVKNRCSHDLQAWYRTNGDPHGQMRHVAHGKTTTINVEDNWEGRVWARGACTKSGCDGTVASLAEFRLNGANNIDYYDVSFVDGYNLPIRIEPTNMVSDHTVASDPRHCQPTFCTHTPSCPHDLSFYSGSKFVACQSACSRYQEDAYCCTGSFSSPSTCTSNHFSRAIKVACPNVYTYPYDDDISVYGCQAPTYIVTFCPA
ncbi:thaumatin, partial [Fennellomyces sp. T-0311]